MWTWRDKFILLCPTQYQYNVPNKSYHGTTLSYDFSLDIMYLLCEHKKQISDKLALTGFAKVGRFLDNGIISRCMI